MDNLSNVINLVERIEMSPNNDDKLYNMDYFKIMSILNNPSYHINLDLAKKQNFKLIDKNFKFSNRCNFILKNKDVYDYLTINNYRSDYTIILNQKLINQEFINYYLINYYEDNFNYFMIVISIDTEKLTKEFYDNFTLDNQNKNDKLFVSYLLTLMKYHFEEINNFRNDSCENVSISKLIAENTINYMSDKMIEEPAFLKTKLFSYQKANIFWMQNRENNNKNIILDETMIINWGPNLEFNFKNLKFEPKRTVDNTELDKLNKFLGGCLCDDVGLGKTLQILSHCFYKKTNNIILVPKHLIEHWKNEFEKHIILPEDCEFVTDLQNFRKNNDKYTTIVITYPDLKYICNFKDICNTLWDRIIIDEYHELTNLPDEMYYMMENKISAKYKWAVTATPFINKNMIHNIVNFVAKNKINSKNISKYKMYINTFVDMFRKNTKKTIEKELKLPKIKESTYYLNFSEKESLYYNTLISSDNQKLEQMKRYFCINPSLYFTENNLDNNFVEINLMDDKIKNIHKEEHEKEVLNLIKIKLKIIKQFCQNKLSITNEISEQQKFAKFIKMEVHKLESIDIDEINELFDTIVQENKLDKNLLDQVKTQIKILENIQKTMNYFEIQLKEINNATTIVKKEDINSADNLDNKNNINYVEVKLEKDCGICLGELDEKFTILQCGHMYCTECITTILQTTLKKCPTCKLQLKNTTIYAIDNKHKKSDKTIDIINLYGTKIANLINICNKMNDKIVLFSHTPTLLQNIHKILNTNNIKSILINKENIYEINEFDKNDSKVLILSSEYNASGLNITCAKNIIILEPLKKDYMYRKQIENQIIGRLHRIGQDKEINFIRLIVIDSIEHQIDKENKINDAIYANKEFDLDLEKVSFTY
jgi:SNF2 family DNA or RNA helicase